MAKFADRALVILQWPFHSRQQRLMRARRSYSKNDFFQFFLSHGVSVKVVDEVWGALVDTAVIKNFKPHPDDELLKTFGLADEDLDEDVVLPLLERCGCRIPTPREIESTKPLKTVTDLIDFISHFRQE